MIVHLLFGYYIIALAVDYEAWPFVLAHALSCARPPTLRHAFTQDPFVLPSLLVFADQTASLNRSCQSGGVYSAGCDHFDLPS